jgi:hypothetical protein
VWDWLYPDGFWAGAPHKAGDQMRLFGFGQVCSLELGYVPKIVSDAIDPELPRMLGEYMANVKAARARARARYSAPVAPDGTIDPNPTRARPSIRAAIMAAKSPRGNSAQAERRSGEREIARLSGARYRNTCAPDRIWGLSLSTRMTVAVFVHACRGTGSGIRHCG